MATAAAAAGATVLAGKAGDPLATEAVADGEDAAGTEASGTILPWGLGGGKQKIRVGTVAQERVGQRESGGRWGFFDCKLFYFFFFFLCYNFFPY